MIGSHCGRRHIKPSYVDDLRYSYGWGRLCKQIICYGVNRKGFLNALGSKASKPSAERFLRSFSLGEAELQGPGIPCSGFD